MTVSITQTPYFRTDVRRERGHEFEEQTYLLKVEGRSPGVVPQLQIGDDFIDICWQDSELRSYPLYGVAYAELFTATTFYGPRLEIIFYSPRPQEPMGVTQQDHDEDDNVRGGTAYTFNVEPDLYRETLGENPTIERRVPYEQIRTREISVTLAGVSIQEEPIVVFRSSIQDVLANARPYDNVDFQEQRYMVEQH